MPTTYNIVDIGTKKLSRRRLFAVMGELGMVEAETGRAMGQEELEDLRLRHTNSRDVSKLAKTTFRLTAVLGLEPTGSNAQDEQGQCEAPSNNHDNEMMWIWFSIFLLAVAWIGVAVENYGSKDAAQRAAAS